MPAFTNFSLNRFTQPIQSFFSTKRDPFDYGLRVGMTGTLGIIVITQEPVVVGLLAGTLLGITASSLLTIYRNFDTRNYQVDYELLNAPPTTNLAPIYKSRGTAKSARCFAIWTGIGVCTALTTASYPPLLAGVAGLEAAAIVSDLVRDWRYQFPYPSYTFRHSHHLGG